MTIRIKMMKLQQRPHHWRHKEAKAVAESDLTKTEKGLADSKASLESASQNCMQVAQGPQK